MNAVVIATWLVRIVATYFACGIIFAIPFVVRGVGEIDPVAREGTWGFRVMIIPGVVALWPLLLKRWLSGAHQPPPECNAHRRAAKERVP